MRVNPSYISNLAASLNQTQAKVEQLTAQLSSGQRVNSLSDDPLAAGQNVLLLNQIQRDDSFTQASSLVQGQLQVADSALGGVVSQLTQAISLATSANNGTLNASDLKSISNQLAGVRDEVLALANTSYQGQYIFGGSETGTVPFSISGTTPAAATYNGDGNVNFLVTPNGQRIQLNVPGDKIFMAGNANDVLGTLNQLIADFASGQASSTAIADTTALSTAVNFVSQQRVVLDNSLTRLTAATEAAGNEKMQLTAAQTNLMQADVADIATQLSLSKTQQTALQSVIAQVGAGSLFDKI
ncbi:MAG TPA: flagellar hook-associated protein FlgL [Terracidiphilus sp.]